MKGKGNDNKAQELVARSPSQNGKDISGVRICGKGKRMQIEKHTGDNREWGFGTNNLVSLLTPRLCRIKKLLDQVNILGIDEVDKATAEDNGPSMF